ncbi:guanosine-diphosphatase [Lineolata rhizophorae]|uniref:guanosine-diphosphatase n=1 Tax=Lineolata rhizophorae TaxID=578093 RepID=A0A6A6NMB8_9PEZI|nr:guanosine-diphosphatase [Lineolata rhizophorae]
MSSGVDVGGPRGESHPGIWSYFSFGSSSAPRRRTSVSLPHSNSSAGPSASASDPFEKPDRHSGYPGRASNGTAAGFMKDLKFAGMNQGQRSRYLKACGLLFFVFLVFFFFAPGERARLGFSGDNGKWPGGDVASDPSVSTDRCTKSSSSHKPLVQYALMIDAGSTGSRIHVYRFNNCGETPELEDEIFEQTAKKEGGSGLSSYKEDAEGAAMSLDPLMEVAMQHVPDKLKPCTPVAVKATAGLRKLGPELSDRILEAVRTRLETKYPFPLVSAEKGGVEVMEGRDEGVYAWITANYLLGKIGGPDDTPTAAVFDLGGGSTQIVFQPTFKGAADGGLPEKLADGDHKYELSFGGRDFTLYQHSYLGYGLMAARENLHKLVATTLLGEGSNADAAKLRRPVLNPCIAPGMWREVEVELDEGHPLGPSVKVNMTGPTEDGSLTCRALAEKTLQKDAECKLHPCAFNGVHQPSLAKTFAREDVYLFSYFYDRTSVLGMPESFSLAELGELTKRVCRGEKSGAWDVFGAVDGAVDELKDRPETCLDLNFMMALLHTGYEMPIDREVKIAKKIKGRELGWCLGASLPLLNQESGWQCKIREVTK